MEIETATATEIKNSFGKYLEMVMSGNEVIITKNGTEVGRIIPQKKTISFLTDSLNGVIKDKFDLKHAKSEAMEKKYGSSH